MNPDFLQGSIPGGPKRLGIQRHRAPTIPRELRQSVILTDETRQCIRRLAAYKPPPPPAGSLYPRSRSAAVLVALFVGRTGELYVMLNRRSESLRAFPGDTSLPGGRWEPGDKALEDTARREAFEEIGLPRDRQRLPALCYLQPFVTGTNLLVTPVIVLILDPNIRPVLNEPEVSALFSHPFKSFLSRSSPFSDGLHHKPHSADPRIPPQRSPFYGTPHLRSIISGPGSRLEEMNTKKTPAGKSVLPDLPLATIEAESSRSVVYSQELRIKSEGADAETRALGWKKYRASTEPPPKPGEDEATDMEYYSYRDISWGQGPVRMHRFLSGREDIGIKPVYGLTGAILLHAAMVGYGREPEFAIRAPGEKSILERIGYALEHVPTFVKAVNLEREELEGHQGRTLRRNERVSRL